MINILDDNLQKSSDSKLRGPQPVNVNPLKNIDNFHYKKVGSIRKEVFDTIFAEPVRT